MMDGNWDKLLSVLADAAIIIIPIVGAFAVSWLRTKTKQITEGIENDKKKFAVKSVGDVIADVVERLNQTMVEKLKMANEDDRLTEDEIEMIEEECIRIIFDTLSSGTINILSGVFDDVEEWIRSRIEREVGRRHQTNMP